MKIIFLILFTLIMYLNSYEQIHFIEHIITNSANSAHSQYPCDINGDGDMDVLSAEHWGENKIVWYENTDGNGNFGSEQIIAIEANGTESVHAADIDGDGDMDVLSGCWNDDKIAWYENTDGNGNFGIEQIITIEAKGVESVYAADIDGDGDMDVLSGSSKGGSGQIAWFENQDGQGTFSWKKNINTDAHNATSVYADDIDGDGDMDVLFTTNNKISWHEKIDGQDSFGPEQIITTSVDGTKRGFTSDIDGDGDLDIISASYWDGKLAWYENQDGHGNFGLQQVIATYTGLESVDATDLDLDGDMDILAASSYAGSGTIAYLAWHENINGIGAFGNRNIIDWNIDRYDFVLAANFDEDLDMDILYTDGRDKVAWFENLHPSSVNQSPTVHFSVYPVPTDGILTVEANSVIAYIEIYNTLNQLVRSNKSRNNIDISEQKAGLYFCRIIDEKGDFGIIKVLKK